MMLRFVTLLLLLATGCSAYALGVLTERNRKGKR